MRKRPNDSAGDDDSTRVQTARNLQTATDFHNDFSNPCMGNYTDVILDRKTENPRPCSVSANHEAPGRPIFRCFPLSSATSRTNMNSTPRQLPATPATHRTRYKRRHRTHRKNRHHGSRGSQGTDPGPHEGASSSSPLPDRRSTFFFPPRASPIN